MNRPRSRDLFHQIRHIGDDTVDAVHVVAGEGHTAVHHDDLAAVLIGGHVLADLIQTAQRDDFQFFCHIFCKFSFIVGCSPHGTRRKMGAENRDAPVRRPALHRRRSPGIAPVCRVDQEGSTGREWTSGASRLYMNAWAHWPRAAYKQSVDTPRLIHSIAQCRRFVQSFPSLFSPFSRQRAKKHARQFRNSLTGGTECGRISPAFESVMLLRARRDG